VSRSWLHEGLSSRGLDRGGLQLFSLTAYLLIFFLQTRHCDESIIMEPKTITASGTKSAVTTGDGSEGSKRSGTGTNGLHSPIMPWQTRLIKLLSGHFEDPVRVELRVADIVLAPGMAVASERSIVQYEALSYCWGRPDETKPLDCNDQQLLVPESAVHALRHLRQLDGPRWLWVDAVCINQADDEEKSSQVKQMLTIFAKAMTVVAWLGFSRI
jgi:hypothetical protein